MGWMWGLEGRQRLEAMAKAQSLHCIWETTLMRASLYRLEDINKNCLEEFRKHWKCLDNNNQQLWHCRRPEQLLNKCVLDKLVRTLPNLKPPKEGNAYAFPTPQGLEKKIPGSPEGETPIHLRKTQIFSHNISSIREDEPNV